MKNGFIKVGAATPTIRVADPAYNVSQMLSLATEANEADVRILVFPELSLTGYTCADLFFTETLQAASLCALQTYLAESAAWDMLTVLGLPLLHRGHLYDCALFCKNGKVLGIVPKTQLAKGNGVQECRWFEAGNEEADTCMLFGEAVPFGARLLFSCRTLPSLTLAAEIGTELFSPLSPSGAHACAGATVICNPAARNETVGSYAYEKQSVTLRSAHTASAYLTAGACAGESTTDLVFAPHAILCENGTLLAESAPFAEAPALTVSEIDLEKISFERRHRDFPVGAASLYRTVDFSLTLTETALTRKVDAHPFLPDDADALRRRCAHILSVQALGLKTRVERAYAKKIVVGISGGLDSTLALLVMVRAMDALKRPRKDIVAVTMPCFGTTARTKTNATVLCEELGVDFRTVDIFDAVNVHFRDIGHDPAVRNVTYENAQARERTQILMDIANDCDGMVIGTGDLSELALGWATYNGDHMSMYGVNAAIPKTLVRHLVAHSAEEYKKGGRRKIAAALLDVLDTPVSPELLPAEEDGSIAQKTEDLVGPYELHDFYLYHMLREGASPKKLYRLAHHAFAGVYDDETLKKWLRTFVRRFFSQQFKRSCLPDGPKVGSVGVSPRGDWAMPSDASAALWREEAEAL